ncbi:MAG: hypothetical protein IT456_00040 [Planctomycetes bacterium]|nr:hypothetical protein [Planctomycetota bacterium]
MATFSHLRALPFALATLATSLMAQWPATNLASEAFGTARFCYDEARARLVVHAANGSFWEHDGQSWSRRTVTTPQGISLFYDPRRQRVLVFGATLQSYDGYSLEPLGQTPNYNKVLADRARGILVGVRSVVQGNNITIAIDEAAGSTFAQVASIPSSRLLLGAEYDAAQQITWLQTLVPQAGGGNEMWSWNGQQLTGPIPYQGAVGSIAYDPAQGRILAAGAGVQWHWNGTQWHSVPLAFQPPGGGTYTADHRHGQLLWLSPNTEDWVWSWNGSQWSRGPSLPQPSCSQFTMTFDEARQRAVLLGANSATSARQVHAEWDGLEWQLLPLPANGPATLFHSAQAYDSARHEIVVFGGEGPAAPQVQGDTWIWNGTAWRLGATNGPSPRTTAAMTYDSVQNRVVLVGGRNSAQGPWLKDHWQWDGVAWQQIVASGPFDPVKLVLGFDPIRDRVVAHNDHGNTYEYDGSSWQLVAGNGPAPTPMWQLVWNPWRGMLEGLFLPGQLVAQTFAWNGATWSAISSGPALRVFDQVRGVSLAHLANLSVVESATAAATQRFGIACGTGTTSLVAYGVPRLGSANFHVDLRTDAAQRPAMFGFGLSTGNQPLGNGCVLLLQNAFASRLWFTDAFGFVQLPVPLPSDPALRGVVLHSQCAVLDPASPGSLAMSQGLTLRLGH